MNDGIIRPTRGVTTPVPGAANPSLPGMGQRAAANPYGGAVNTDPLAQLRSMIDMPQNQGGAAAGNIKWEQYGDARFEDQALRDLRNESNVEQDINQLYVQKYAQATTEFTVFLCSRRGTYYDEYRNILENFRLNNKTHAPCMIRDEFITTLNRHPELIQGIARAAAPMYGQRLINIAKSKQSGEVERNEYISALHFALRSTLVMEMISWLCKTPQGRQKAFSLTPEIKDMVAKLESYKDVFGVACATFGVTNPYAGLVYDVQLPTRTDISLISEAQTAHMYNDYSRYAGVESQNMDNGVGSLQEMIARNAERARRNANTYVEPQHDPDSGSGRWNKFRTDYQNMTPANKKEFDYRKFFYSIGKKNHYFVPESDWKNLKHIFKRHEDQPPQEESVMQGCFRIVIIDLNDDTGWFSTVVRNEGFDMPTVLTNPEKLLPLLEAVQDSTEVTVSQVAVEEALGKKNKTLVIPVETVNKLDGIPLVTIKEPIAATSSKKLYATVVTSNDELSKNFKHTNAISFNTTIWETYTCADASDRIRLIDDLPFLFRDKVVEGKPLSFYQLVQQLNRYFRDQIVDDEIAEFIDNRLTVMVNEWFVNCLGYDNNPNSANHLSISSIVRDFDDLDKDLEAHDDQAFRLFNAPSGPENYLTEQMRIFTAENKYEEDQKGLGILQKAQKDRELVMERPLFITVVNKRQGPIADEAGEPLVIKRSKFPEYFDLVEKGFEPTMGADKDIRATDKILRFSSDDHLWLFSYSAYDRNVATMRRVSRRMSLLFLSLV